jgi:VIT1/CCC1 family predicted Fe2+/Mn2+ transporter
MSITKRLDQAREAYKNKDLNASQKAHQKKAIANAAKEAHGGAGSQYIGNMVLGGLDGIITTFAVVSGVAGANLGANVVMIMGVANLLADGLSMAIGAFLSEKSVNEYYSNEKRREIWEVENYPEGERLELKEIYKSQGYPDSDVAKLVEIKTANKKRWVETMMVEELGLLADEKKPLTGSAITFASFVVAGSLPLLSYLVGLFVKIPMNIAFYISIGLSAFALFALGAAKVKVTGLKPIRSGLEMLLVGGLAAGVAYGVGVLLGGIGG